MADAAGRRVPVVCAGIVVADVFVPPLERMPSPGELVATGNFGTPCRDVARFGRATVARAERRLTQARKACSRSATRSISSVSISRGSPSSVAR